MNDSSKLPPNPLPEVSRRGFLGSLTASLALLGTEGCRRATEKVVPYQSVPEQVIPGQAMHFATVYARRGDAVGLVVESHEGRPTKIEGNPLHPSSLGAVDAITQASVLDLYDPERTPSPLRAGAKSTWDAFAAELDARLSKHATDLGATLRVLATPTNSPTVQRLRAAFGRRFPAARVHTYAPVDAANVHAGSTLALGRAMQPLLAFDQAKVILSLDSDFLQTEPGNVRAHRSFSVGRAVTSPQSSMSRLYVVEPGWSTTGLAADHRLPLPAGRVPAYAAALAAELARLGLPLGAVGDAAATVKATGAFEPRWIQAVAKDLLRGGKSSVLVVGTRQPAIVHALACAVNRALGSEGPVVSYVDAFDPSEAKAADLASLVSAIGAGKVETLLLLGGNPVYDAPADLHFQETLSKVQLTAHLAGFVDETSAGCVWHLPMTHELEAWGDQRALDGTVALQQPLIAPLFGGKSELEIWASLAGEKDARPYDLVRATSRAPLLLESGLTSSGDGKDGKIDCTDALGVHVQYPVLGFEHDWKKALRDGVLAAAKVGAPVLDPGAALALRAPDIAAELAKTELAAPPTRERLEVAFTVDAKMLDGRHANNTWLQELADPITKITWDNAGLVSPKTASELGIETGDVIKLSRGDRSVTIAAYVLPGTADGTVILPLGWGRTQAGRIGNRRGFDVFPLRTTDAMGFAGGVSATRTGERYEFARTQQSDSMEGRPLVREATLEEYRQKPHFAELEVAPRRSLPLWTDVDYSKGHQWGMTIDLNACTGCSACVVACQAENNIPVVGKEEVAKGRDMQWLRIDRYFEGEAEEPRALVQPMACVQCEEAPCENVCPVAALEHSAEGLSEITYNRCIGTRYCANNCPYKVRRFNFLNWHNDGVWNETGGLPETLQMQQNPNVTVRFRGVIEKCSYCVQRIQSHRLATKREGRDLRDGDIVTACQQTCPADAIVFGDLNDLGSQVSKLAMGDRRYGLLQELGIKPRTTFLAKIQNPNPEMA